MAFFQLQKLLEWSNQLENILKDSEVKKLKARLLHELAIDEDQVSISRNRQSRWEYPTLS